MYINYLQCPMLGDAVARTRWQVIVVIHLDLIHLIHFPLKGL
jgi:hypothetical protein